MGSETSKPSTPAVTHEQIVNIINASSIKTKEHAEKTANSLQIIAYIFLAVVIASIIYGVYKLLARYERMRTEIRMTKATSLTSVRAAIV